MLQMKTKTGRAASCSAIFRNGSAHILFILAKFALETFMSLNAASNFLFLSKNSGPGIGWPPTERASFVSRWKASFGFKESLSATTAGEEPAAVPGNVLSGADISSGNVLSGNDVSPSTRDW